jgi:hypothetical protein
MSHVYPVTPDHPLCGIWVAMCPADSCEYPRTEYMISVAEGQFYVTGFDPINGEKFLIYGVAYDGESLGFVSYVLSTGRTGQNWMRIVEKDKVKHRFTFTERGLWFTERKLWVRKAFTPGVIASQDAEPGAPPNGGPAERLAKSAATRWAQYQQAPFRGGVRRMRTTKNKAGQDSRKE